MAKFLIAITITTCLIMAGGICGYDELPGYFYKTLFFLFISTVGLFRFLLRTKQQRPDFFVQFYLATLAVKLIAFGAYVFLMVRNQPGQAHQNIIFFMVVYVLFTALEIGFLYRHVNQ